MELKKIAEELLPRSMAARDWVFQVIRSAIIRGALPGNMPLKQDEISAALNVSHIPVREAFRQLESQGLVRIYPNRGAVVTKLSQKEMGNVMDARIMLELGALRAAIPFISPGDIDKAREFLDRFAERQDYYNSYRLNLSLHSALYAPCDNAFLLTLIEQMHANVDRYLYPYFDGGGSAQLYSVEEHGQLIDACESHDAELATALLRTHLESTKQLLLSSSLLD
ncbi:MAG: GntR family transcriptional regulator [Clostridia bacterium]|nr:GntR family transcriptional regulator [Candidatus Pelethousia sp.]NCB31099.1 GntR family transcriptional regulator [Clostridia bacterium]